MTVQQRLLQHAAELLDGPDNLARRLLVPRQVVQAWLDGGKAVPPWAFLRAADIINDEAGKRA
jgi:hypothetical protein